MRTESMKRAQQQYKRKNVPMTFLFLPKKDMPIIRKIKSQQNQTDYIRELVLRDIRFGGKFKH